MTCYHKILVGKARILTDVKIEEENKDIKWTTLEHNGLYFPEEYTQLPNNVKLKYKEKRIDLNSRDTDNEFNITAEEAAVFFATKLEQDERLIEKQKNRKRAVEDNVFVENFFRDWKKILGNNTVIQDWKNIDFSEIQNYIKQSSEEKKKKSKEEKQEEKEEKDKIKEVYGYAIVDGYKSALNGWIVQPPGLFIGHGEQPNRGKIKARLRPKDIIINCSKGKEPKCFVKNKPCKWGNIVNDVKVTWIASYKNSVTNLTTYVYLDRKESMWVCASDKIKFDKAKNLKTNIETIRLQYKKDLESKVEEVRQLAVAVYLLDKLAIRPGAEKDEKEEANTVGLTTLKCTNINFLEDNYIELKFIGKSSIEFQKKFKVESIVYNILKQLCRAKREKPIFENVDASKLNIYLGDIVPNITAKVFRTWKACSTLQDALDKLDIDKEDTVAAKKIAFDKVNIKVAEALNHKALTQNDNKVTKIQQKLEEEKNKLEEEKNQKKIEKIQQKINQLETKLEEAEGNISLTTSKVNYIDPRIIVSWCKRVEMPIEKIYNKTSLKKFTWAIQNFSDWKF